MRPSKKILKISQSLVKGSFEILPYHEYGKEKWTLPYEVNNGFITKSDLENFEKLFTENGLKIIHM